LKRIEKKQQRIMPRPQSRPSTFKEQGHLKGYAGVGSPFPVRETLNSKRSTTPQFQAL
jgi:hypothetical protein